MATGFRRVGFVDWMQYQDHTGGGMWNGTTTYPWRQEGGGSPVWHSDYTETTGVGDMYVSAGVGSSYLTAQETFTPSARMAVDFAIDFDGTYDAGVYVMAATGSLDRNSYRI